MTNHPNRSAGKVEVTTNGQGHALAYINDELVAGISTDRNGRWIMQRMVRDGGSNQIAGDEKIDVSGIFHNTADINRAIRLFAENPSHVAAVWPEHGLRALCKAAMDTLSIGDYNLDKARLHI